MRGQGSKHSMRTIVAFVGLAILLAGLALVPSVRASIPATWHVTLGAASPDMALMGMAFYPNAITIHQGDTVVFTNVLLEPHTVTFGAGTGPLDPFQFMAPSGGTTFTGDPLNSGWLFTPSPFPWGSSVSITIDVGPGTYAYRCALHPLMMGTITVAPDGQKLPLTDSQYQKRAQARMTVDIAHARDIAEASAQAAATAADLGGTGIEVAVGGGDGVSTVMRFFPSDLTIHMGETVTFVNQDPYTPHTVTFGPEPAGAPESLTNPYGTPTDFDGTTPLNSGFLLPFVPWGMMFSVTFTATGTFPYICGLHDEMGMTGTVTVLP